MVDIIEKKRDGQKLSKAEIEFFVKGVVDGSSPIIRQAPFLWQYVLTGWMMRKLFAAHADDGGFGRSN